MSRHPLRISASIEASTPLYKRVPTHDEHGRPCSDFMMLIPGLRDLPEAAIGAKLDTLGGVLAAFKEVIFADLNLPLNLLWVSVRVRPGVILDVAAQIAACVPEARLVSHHS